MDHQPLIYVLAYTDECGQDHEKYIEGWTSQSCYDQAQRLVNQNAGLWTGCSLTDPDGEEVVPAGACWF